MLFLLVGKLVFINCFCYFISGDFLDFSVKTTVGLVGLPLSSSY